MAPFRLRLSGTGWEQTLRGTLVAATWDVVFFPWKPDADPRRDLEGWRRLADAPEAVRAQLSALDFPYGWRGPIDLGLGEAVTQRGPGGDHFGLRARTQLNLPAGRWRFRTLSDDGVRVQVNGRPVIENWTWHGPTVDEGFFEQPAAGPVAITVEHFEIDGYAVLRLDLEPAD